MSKVPVSLHAICISILNVSLHKKAYIVHFQLTNEALGWGNVHLEGHIFHASLLSAGDF